VIDLVKRGHTLGGGMITPDKKYFYLNIPKNASTFTNNVLTDNHWLLWNIAEGEFNNAIFVLRDPVERWISGFTTYVSLWILAAGYGSEQFIADYNRLTEKFIFDTIVFDDHTMPQTFFINNIPSSVRKHYVWADANTLINSISSITGINLNVNTDTMDNNKDSNASTSSINKFIKSRMTPELISKIQEAYKEDYNLINSVNIHGK
jgi:hypothetical protein